MSSSPKPRPCPLCQHAMVGSTSREELPSPDIYKCLNCGTEVHVTPGKPGPAKSGKS